MLSQAEIDALLTGAIEIDSSDGEEQVNLAQLLSDAPAGEPAPAPAKDDNRRVKPYNFWSPDRFSKEQMRAIELIHEDLAERLTASLPTILRTNVRPRVVHTEQGRFHDFLQDLPPASLFHIIALAPLPGHMVITLSPEIGHAILELQLGGRSEMIQENRNLTEIDQLLLRGLVEQMLNDVKAAWSKIVVIEPGLDDTTVNYHWVHMVMGNERVMLIAFELSVQSVTGTMNVYIPFTMLKPIASLLNPYIWISGQKERKADPDERRMIADNLSRVTLPVRVVLGGANLSFADLLNLQPGDVIRLEQSTRLDLPVQVAGKTRFMGKAGRAGQKVAVQITQVLDPGEDEPFPGLTD